MATRRVIYIRNPSNGSNFRTLGGKSINVHTGGGTRPSKGITFPTLPTITITVHPDYVQWLPLGQGWVNLQNNSYLTQGFGAANPSDYIPAVRRATQGVKQTDWVEFLFEDTVFDKDFWAFTDLSNMTGNSAEDNYYRVAENAGIKNPPPPVYGKNGILGFSDGGDTIRREIWNAFNSPHYWDLDPSND